MTPLLVTLAVALAAPAGDVIDVAFLPEQPQLPPLVIRVAQNGAERTVAWLIPAERPATGVITDQKGVAGSLLPLPQAPAGAALRDDGGLLVITIDDAGDWQGRFANADDGAARKSRVAGVSVGGDRALRLVVPALGAPPGAAALVGAQQSIPGTGIALRVTNGPRALVRSGSEVLLVHPTPLDGAAACAGVVPIAFSGDQPAIRLVATAAPACASGLAAVWVSGAQIGARRDQPAAGVVLTLVR